MSGSVAAETHPTEVEMDSWWDKVLTGAQRDHAHARCNKNVQLPDPETAALAISSNSGLTWEVQGDRDLLNQGGRPPKLHDCIMRHDRHWFVVLVTGLVSGIVALAVKFFKWVVSLFKRGG